MPDISRDHLYSLLNHKIVLTSAAGQQEGYLVCVDPVTLAIVLYDDVHQRLSMVMHHALKSINKSDQLENNPNNIDFKQLCGDFFGLSTTGTNAKLHTPSEQRERRERVLSLLRTNNVPVEEKDDLLIAAYSVCINAPYTESDCQSTNALILSRIQNILKQAT